ncbi:MFS transporter [Microbacterium sp. GXF7504]
MAESGRSRPALTPAMFAVLAILTALAPLSMDIYIPSLPAMQADLGGADWLAQGSITGCLLGIALGQLVCGPLSDRLGRRPVILVGVIGWTVTCALCALATDPVLLVAIRVVVGVCGAAGIVVARSIMRDVSDDPHQVASRVGLLSTVTAIAPVVAPVLGAGIAVVGGWRGDFVVLAAFGGILSLAFALTVPETLPADARVADRGIARALVRGLRDRELAWVTAGMLAYGIGFYAYVATTAFVVERELGYPPIVFALVFGTNAAAMFVANLSFRRIVRRLHPSGPLAVGLLVSACGGLLGLVAALSGLPDGVLWLASTVFAAGAGFVLPATHGWGQSVAVASGAASALTGAAQFLGGALGSPLTGVIGIGATSLAAVVLAGSACALGCCLLARAAMRRRAAPASR